MQNNQVFDDLEEFVKQQKLNDNLRIEAKVGTIIAKTEDTLIDMRYFQDYIFFNVESKIEKKNYRFESAISHQDYLKACQMLKSEKRWEFSLDIIFSLTYSTQISFRMGYDEQGKIFCFQRKKELKEKHLDVFDHGRQYRITLAQYNIIDYNQTDVCLQKIKEYLKDDQLQISCVRYKQTMIYISDENCESFVYKVQQIEKHKQAFLIEIAKEIINVNNSFKKNLDNALELLQKNNYYYKPFYEAEISIKQYKNAQSTQDVVENYLKKIQQFHDNVRTKNPDATQFGLRDAQIQKKYIGQDQKQGNYQSKHGQQFKTRGQQHNQNNNRKQQQYTNNQDESTQMVGNNYQEKQNQQRRGGERVRGRRREYGYEKEREEQPNSDDEQFQSRQEDYY